MQTTQIANRYRPVKGQRTAAELVAVMREKGVNPRQIMITAVGPGLHEKAEGIKPQPVYIISRPGKPAATSGNANISGRFIKTPCNGLNLPPEARKLLVTVDSFEDIDECAVFLSTRLADSHLGLVLAMRLADQWFELYRWTASWNELEISRLYVSQF